jgi:hypothetical protein
MATHLGGTMSPDANDHNESGDENPKPPGRSAGDDLVEGLGLLLQAARKAVDSVDTRPIEQLGRRATERLKARDWEEVAERGGRRVMSVLGRIARQVDERLAAATSPRSPRPTEGTQPAGSNPAGSTPPSGADAKPRTRVDEE